MHFDLKNDMVKQRLIIFVRSLIHIYDQCCALIWEDALGDGCFNLVY